MLNPTKIIRKLSLSTKAIANIPLRTVLVVPFVLQIFAAVGLTGYLSFRNGQQAVNEKTKVLTTNGSI